ncbi:cyclase family protein [Puerhibacterium puerhi]|uniref:cyclase family protein n=1 Tax=Puerhibacterium puerhi TaxID=2692623 RepID=UPI00135993AE|nr:cyclase family protein [Puerhibacterium puerhi]
MPTASTIDTTKAQFDELAARVRVWGDGRDGVPLYRRITDQVARTAFAEEVRIGRTVGLSRPLPTQPDLDNPRPALHYLSMAGSTLAEGDVEPTCYKDFVGVDYHGKVVSHIDSFSHIAYEGAFFGGADAAKATTAEGMRVGDVTEFGVLATRGVLLDMPALTGEPWTEPGTVWSLADVQEALARTGVTLRAGDALLLRNGHDRRRRELGAWDADAAAAGLHAAAVPWLLEQGVSVFGADGETDVRPSPVAGVTLPIHVLCLTMAGVPLLDNLELDALSEACAQAGRSTFALVVAPLNIPGSTGSPLNPVAIL